MKEKIKLITKGILFWVTAAAMMSFIAGADIIYIKGYFVEAIISIIALIIICVLCISEEVLKKITLYNKFNKLIEE